MEILSKTRTAAGLNSVSSRMNYCNETGSPEWWFNAAISHQDPFILLTQISPLTTRATWRFKTNAPFELKKTDGL